MAVARYAWSGRERLGLLRIRDDVIVLHAMRWPDEIRDPSSLTPPPVEVSDEEIDRALALMNTMTRDDLEGPEFRNTYTEAVAKLIEAKREHREPAPAPEAAEESGQLVDLMAALNESVAKAKASRSDGGHADVHDMPTKRATNKAPAKKTAAKKTARKPRKTLNRVARGRCPAGRLRRA
ncbi:Ku protein [Streptomyces sp. PAL114]|uniref:Ku protein n=1 Tax=Streptomyces sp. PAL114 TaxID=2970893 RepID=UPI0028FDC034|nr:Ku protein [Streptomyces sp. PAL114]MDU0301924.1 hypothetical protein [Streptomyces sp. PAL114]